MRYVATCCNMLRFSPSILDANNISPRKHWRCAQHMMPNNVHTYFLYLCLYAIVWVHLFRFASNEFVSIAFKESLDRCVLNSQRATPTIAVSNACCKTFTFVFFRGMVSSRTLSNITTTLSHSTCICACTYLVRTLKILIELGNYCEVLGKQDYWRRMQTAWNHDLTDV